MGNVFDQNHRQALAGLRLMLQTLPLTALLELREEIQKTIQKKEAEEPWKSEGTDA